MVNKLDFEVTINDKFNSNKIIKYNEKKLKLKILNKKIIDLSIVVSTYQGSKRLLSLLLSVCNSSVIPKEIIIVGTNNNDFVNLNIFLKILNLKLKVSERADQIYQRKMGFKFITCNYVIQSDDDISFSPNCLETLFNDINKRTKTILCPLIIDEYGQRADIRTIKHYNNNYFFRYILLFLNNFKTVKGGSLLNSGRPVPDINVNNQREWLNSCLCFSVSSLKFYESFENKGKAFYEDVFTSHNFYKNGFQLLKIENATIIHEAKPPLSFKEHIFSISNQFKIVKRFNKSKILFFCDVIIFSLVFLFYK